MFARRRIDLLQSAWGRRVVFTALYLSEGAPIGYIWWALPTMLRSAGVPVDQITRTTAALTLVWALKFLWAPIVDAVRTPPWGLRQWIIVTQLGMGLALLPLLIVPTGGSLSFLTAVLFIHAFFASTQDASVDALCIAATASEERGRINGWMQVGMLVGRALFGGVSLYVERWVGREAVVLLLLCAIWSSTVLVVFFTREPARPAPQAAAGRLRTGLFFHQLARAFGRPAMCRAVGFALLSGASFEAAGAVAGPLLIDSGLVQERVGFFFAGPVVLATALGALAGGALSDRLGHTRAVISLTAMIATTVLALAGACLAHAATGAWSALALLALLYLFYGAFAAASYAMFMDITDPRLGATQFSALMSATNLCEVWAAYTVGRLVASSGYSASFLVFAIASFASIPLVVGLDAGRSSWRRATGRNCDE